ncbi:MAG: heparinase II/III family protein [Gemmatimonadaceae bacterium]
MLRLIDVGSATAKTADQWRAAQGARELDALSALGPVAGAEEAERTARVWLEDRLDILGLRVPWADDWRMAGPSPLWRYHLHYHEHLADLAWLAGRTSDPAMVRRLALDLRGWNKVWASGGAPAWDPYPVSVRLVSWLRILAWAGPLLDAPERDLLERGIARHVASLRSRLEWHIDGNHLLRNTSALVLGSSVLEGPESESLQDEAVTLFERTLAEQVPGDGIHLERTPMYHVRALRDAIEVEACLKTRRRNLGASSVAIIDRMAAALPWMLRADGELWMLNDTAHDHGVDLAPLLARAAAVAEPPSGLRYFGDAHLVVIVADRDRLRIDLGGPAPAHQPGHAHAGALGFELDVEGFPFIVDGGCSGYDGDPWRAYLRGTAAHNTVAIDGKDQSELWATFRVGARAAVSGVACSGTPHLLTIAAVCRPYHARGVVHRREFRREGRVLVINDVVQGAARRLVESFLHFDPAWDAASSSAHQFVLTRPGARVSVTVNGATDVSLHRGQGDPRIGWYARGFNHVVPSWTLRLREERYVERPWRITITPDA